MLAYYIYISILHMYDIYVWCLYQYIWWVCLLIVFSNVMPNRITNDVSAIVYYHAAPFSSAYVQREDVIFVSERNFPEVLLHYKMVSPFRPRHFSNQHRHIISLERTRGDVEPMIYPKFCNLVINFPPNNMYVYSVRWTDYSWSYYVNRHSPH